MERLGAVGGSERSLSKVQGVEAVYVAPGSLYERNMGWLPRANKVHTIPTGYWKVISTGGTSESPLLSDRQRQRAGWRLTH